METTEEFSLISSEDVEFMEQGKFEPATDDEELSELEEDDKKTMFKGGLGQDFNLTDGKKKVCWINRDERMPKMDEAVTFKQFVNEMENVSESDVCDDWSENEVNNAAIRKNESGDSFGKMLTIPKSPGNFAKKNRKQGWEKPGKSGRKKNLQKFASR